MSEQKKEHNFLLATCIRVCNLLVCSYKEKRTDEESRARSKTSRTARALARPEPLTFIDQGRLGNRGGVRPGIQDAWLVLWAFRMGLQDGRPACRDSGLSLPQMLRATEREKLPISLRDRCPCTPFSFAG